MPRGVIPAVQSEVGKKIDEARLVFVSCGYGNESLLRSEMNFRGI